MVAAALQPPSLQVSMQSWASVKSLMSKAVASVEAFGSGEPAANQRGGAAGGDDNDPLFGSEAGGGGRGGSAAAARGDDAVRPPIQPPTAIRLFFLSPSTLSLSLSLSLAFFPPLLSRTTLTSPLRTGSKRSAPRQLQPTPRTTPRTMDGERGTTEPAK